MKTLSALCGLTLALATAAAAAQDYPNRPITLVVPYAAGGVTDKIARMLGENASKKLGQTIVIENKPGANGTMGAVQMLNARPDGYTVTMVPIGVFRNPYLNKTQYDPIKDLTYISMVAGYNYYIVTQADAPWRTVPELVEHAKQKKAAVSYGTPGTYSSQHIAMVQLGKATSAPWTHIPFKGDSDALSNLLGNHINLMVSASTILPQVKSGKVRVLASLGDKRTQELPEAPTLKELGYPVVHTSPFGIVGPKGMDAAVVAKLDSAFKEVLADPNFQSVLLKEGVTPAYMGPEAYSAYARKTFAHEKDVMQLIGGELKQ